MTIVWNIFKANYVARPSGGRKFKYFPTPTEAQAEIVQGISFFESRRINAPILIFLHPSALPSVKLKKMFSGDHGLKVVSMCHAMHIAPNPITLEIELQACDKIKF